MKTKPIIGITMDLARDSEKYSYAPRPWYALRADYSEIVTKSGGIALMIPYGQDIEALLDVIDGLIIPGGDEDIHPKFYNQEVTYGKLKTNDTRASFELELVKKALERDMPILGICNGLQVLNTVFGGTLIQHIPDYHTNDIATLNEVLPGARSKAHKQVGKRRATPQDFKVNCYINHEQPAPKHPPSHSINIKSNTKLSKLSDKEEVMVNSTHHQAIDQVGQDLIVSARAPDGIIEAIESTKHKFVIGVEWHPEYLNSDLDKNLFKSLIQACLMLV